MKMVLYACVIFVFGYFSSCSNSADKASAPAKDTKPPVVMEYFPKGDQVDSYDQILITFDPYENIDSNSVNRETLKLYELTATGRVEVAPAAENGIVYLPKGKAIRFTPENFLKGSTSYLFEIKADTTAGDGLKDLAGHVLTPNNGNVYSWTFTTIDNLGNVAIKSVYPTLSTQDQETDTDIRVVLNSRYVKFPVINDSVLSVSYTMPGSVEPTELKGNLVFDAAQSTLVFKPENPLPYARKIDVRLNLSGEDGKLLLSDFKWSFTTRRSVLSSVYTLSEGSANIIYNEFAPSFGNTNPKSIMDRFTAASMNKPFGQSGW